MPLAEEGGSVTSAFEHFGHREFLRMRHRVEAFQISGFADADGIGAGHQRGTGNAADGLRVKSLEHQPARRHAIQVRGFDRLGAEASEVLVALVIGEDDDDVGPRCGGVGCEREQNERQKNKHCQ